MRRIGYAGVALLIAMGAQLQMPSADARDRRQSSPEVRVEQARGTLPPSAKTIDSGAKSLKGTPEGGATTGTSAGSSAPVTCNQQNASSQACYSATQQARPVTR
jgi:hypothetical protein